jgi:hypothetical protein
MVTNLDDLRRLREATGEERGPDTGLHHSAHAAWNALARLDLALRKTPNDKVEGRDACGRQQRR